MAQLQILSAANEVRLPHRQLLAQFERKQFLWFNPSTSNFMYDVLSLFCHLPGHLTHNRDGCLIQGKSSADLFHNAGGQLLRRFCEGHLLFKLDEGALEVLVRLVSWVDSARRENLQFSGKRGPKARGSQPVWFPALASGRRSVRCWMRGKQIQKQPLSFRADCFQFSTKLLARLELRAFEQLVDCAKFLISLQTQLVSHLRGSGGRVLVFIRQAGQFCQRQ